MEGELWPFLPVAKIDDRVSALRERIRHINRKIESAKKAGVDARAEGKRIEGALKELLEEERSQRRELQRVKNLAESAQRALDAGAGDAAAAERQLAHCAESTDAIETQMLEQMMQRDELEQAQTDNAAAIQAADDLLAEHEATLAPEKAKHIREGKDLLSQRETHLAAIPPDTVALYIHQFKRHGSALACVDDGACEACKRVAPPRASSPRCDVETWCIATVAEGGST